MPIITIPKEQAQFIEAWASANYQYFYKRMSSDPEVRKRSVYIGKIGEEAIAHHLGIEADYTKRVDKGYDLRYGKEYIAVKTKQFKSFPILDGQWCHIPIDQYQKIRRKSTILVACIVLEELPNVWVVGYLRIGEADSLKELHKAGQWLTSSFRLPPPDSWAIKYSHFRPIEELAKPEEKEFLF